MTYNTQFTLTVTEQTPMKTPVTVNSIIESIDSLTPEQIKVQLLCLQHGEKAVTPDDVIVELRKTNDEAKYALDENGGTGNSCRWYDHERHIKEFSKLYPGFLFTLSGEGEEAGNLWKKYFLNGKVQVCKAKISYDLFDIDKLQ